jgi:hypothetical protein
MILKPSPFEADGLMRNARSTIFQLQGSIRYYTFQSKLPTIFSLPESMGPNYKMNKADLKDVLYNFPVHEQHWTLLGFSHPPDCSAVPSDSLFPVWIQSSPARLSEMC